MDGEKTRLCQKNPRRRRGATASIAARHPPACPQPQTAQGCGQREFPPRPSTPVEGSRALRNSLQIERFCPFPRHCYAGRRAGMRRSRASVEHQLELSTEDLWEEISGRLKEALSDGTYAKWFGDVHTLELEGET